MRVLVQRVTSARVVVDGECVGAIDPDGQGLLALVGVTHTDDPALARKMAEKLWQLRILDGETSAADVGAPILVVSQFTLYGDVRKGRRPSWTRAAKGNQAEPLYERFTAELEAAGVRVERGVFGAKMDVSLTNSGPFTLIVDSDELAGPRRG